VHAMVAIEPMHVRLANGTLKKRAATLLNLRPLQAVLGCFILGVARHTALLQRGSLYTPTCAALRPMPTLVAPLHACSHMVAITAAKARGQYGGHGWFLLLRPGLTNIGLCWCHEAVHTDGTRQAVLSILRGRAVTLSAVSMILGIGCCWMLMPDKPICCS
jgi:hypothetical protein